MAWLHAVPRPNEETQRAKHKVATRSRLEQMKRDRVPIRMPPNPSPYLIAWLIEIGLTEANGMGPTALSWREINAWQAATGNHLTPFEAKVIRELSVAYIAEGRRAEDENCPPPWRGTVTTQELDAVEAKLRLVLG